MHFTNFVLDKDSPFPVGLALVFEDVKFTLKSRFISLFAFELVNNFMQSKRGMVELRVESFGHINLVHHCRRIYNLNLLINYTLHFTFKL